jgi:hypothetical protein
MSRHKAAVSRRRINHDRINRLQKEVEAVWNCVSSLRADLAPAGKEQLIQVRQLCRYFIRELSYHRCRKSPQHKLRCCCSPIAWPWRSMSSFESITKLRDGTGKCSLGVIAETFPRRSLGVRSFLRCPEWQLIPPVESTNRSVCCFSPPSRWPFGPTPNCGTDLSFF